MSLLAKVVDLFRSWRLRRDGRRDRDRRADVRMEQLDHRQLLSVNFTGNVAVDFPATKMPGVVILENAPGTRTPQFPSGPVGMQLQNIIKISGFTISGLRVTYDSTDDTLNFGIEQPDNQKTGQPVIAGDADNNLNSGTTDPAVLAVEPTFFDAPDLGGSESMAIFLDLTGDGIPDVVAGIPPVGGMDPTGPKPYQVADAVVNPMNPSGSIPQFGTPLPQNTGNFYLVNDPAHGAFEMTIKNFSQLYQSKTGVPLTPERLIAVGAYGTSDTDDGISEAFYPANQPFRVSEATPPPPTPPQCPPVSPNIIVNYHEHEHIDTIHDTLIRVTVFGSSGFNVRNIDPASVRLGGAAPAFSYLRKVNNDQFIDRTFVFRGPDVTLPPGFTTATLTGNLLNQPPGSPNTFSSSVTVFNLGPEFYTQHEVDAALARQAARDAAGTRPVPTPGLSGYPLYAPKKHECSLSKHHPKPFVMPPIKGGKKPSELAQEGGTITPAAAVGTGHGAKHRAGAGAVRFRPLTAAHAHRTTAAADVNAM
jgi:hypothetical protein